jgi:hypothetical protein
MQGQRYLGAWLAQEKILVGADIHRVGGRGAGLLESISEGTKWLPLAATHRNAGCPKESCLSPPALLFVTVQPSRSSAGKLDALRGRRVI